MATVPAKPVKPAPAKPAAKPVAAAPARPVAVAKPAAAKPAVAAKPAAPAPARPVAAKPVAAAPAAAATGRKGGRVKMIRDYADGAAYHFGDRVGVVLKSIDKMKARTTRWGDEELTGLMATFQETGLKVQEKLSAMGDAGFTPPSRGFAAKNPIEPGAQVYLHTDAIAMFSRTFPKIATTPVFAALTVQKGDVAIACRLGGAGNDKPFLGMVPKKWVSSQPFAEPEAEAEAEESAA